MVVGEMAKLSLISNQSIFGDTITVFPSQTLRDASSCL